ncbi:holo-ACP synthase [Marinobacterium aestuariivivens]|uniref:Holo-ACP synthase n=1 Tax=Marinobacterium aestuariivivens TaxID=1698799 RepID=A0ABW2A2R1_9GAMM
MILGIGTDLVQIDRIASALARTPALAQRVLTPAEQSGFEASRDPARFLAKRFAAKEAAVKALGTGIGRGSAGSIWRWAMTPWVSPACSLMVVPKHAPGSWVLASSIFPTATSSSWWSPLSLPSRAPISDWHPPFGCAYACHYL